MGQFSGQNVAEDFEISMRVCGESRERLYSIFVQNPQSPKLSVSVVVPVGKGEAVVGVQPADIVVPPGRRQVRRDLGLSEN